jgi:hypothetical protein
LRLPQLFCDAFIDFTTLFKFYQRIEQDVTVYQLFQELTSLFIIEECSVSTKKQRVDSFFMFGWLKILFRYGLFQETIRAFLLALGKHKPGLYEEIRAELSLLMRQILLACVPTQYSVPVGYSLFEQVSYFEL